MATYVKFELEDGTAVYIESAEVAKGSSGLLPANRSESSEAAHPAFEQALEPVGKMAAALLKQLRAGAEDQPEEVQINFGLKAAGDLNGLVVSRGGMEANFNVMLRWRKPEEEDEDDD